MRPVLSFNSDDESIHVSSVQGAIERGMAEDSAKSLLIDFFKGEIDHRNGYKWLRFGGFSFTSLPCGLSLCFFQHTLNMVSFGVSLPNVTLVDGWPTRESIQAEVAFMRKALGSVFLRSFAHGQEGFSWGSVWSVFDEKGMMASSGLRYTQEG